MQELIEAGFEVLVETNGSCNIDVLDNRCCRIVDIKCPSSGEAAQNDLGNLQSLWERDGIKFVIGSYEDFDFAKSILSLLRQSNNRLIKTPLFPRTQRVCQQGLSQNGFWRRSWMFGCSYSYIKFFGTTPAEDRAVCTACSS